MAARSGGGGSGGPGQWRSLQPATPGLAPARVEQLYAALAQEFEPAAALEECWLNDIAQLTARIEGLRQVAHEFYIARMIYLLEDDAFVIRTFDGDELDFLQRAAEIRFEDRPEFGAGERNCIARLMSAAFVGSIDKFRMFEEIERGLLRERDRVVAQFERRRRDKLAAAVKSAELAARPALPAPAGQARGE